MNLTPKDLTKALGTGLFALFLSYGIGITYAAWTAPTVTPPNGNVMAPINTGDTTQFKNGALVVNASTTGPNKAFGLQVWEPTFLMGTTSIGSSIASAGLLLDVEGKVGATQYCDQDGNNCIAAADIGLGGGMSFGPWESKSGATTYQATTDGFVTARNTVIGNDGEIEGLTDSSPSPSTIRVFSRDASNAGYVNVSFPVKKNDYWRVNTDWGYSTTVYWLPIISSAAGGSNSTFGDGSDGAGTISSGPLNRDMYYTDLTVNGVLDTNGYRIFVSGTLTNNGTIRNNGADGADGPVCSGGNGGASGTLVGGGRGGDGFCGSSRGGGGGGGGGVVWISANKIEKEGIIEAKGGKGGNGINPGGTFTNGGGGGGGNITKSLIQSGTGGSGGRISAGGATQAPGGPGGTVSSSNASKRNVTMMTMFLDGLTGSPLGGGGGGGGGAAGIGSPTTQVAAGGGGGQGGIIFTMYKTMITPGTKTVTGGTFGSGVTSAGSGWVAEDGVAGSSGTVVSVQI